VLPQLGRFFLVITNIVQVQSIGIYRFVVGLCGVPQAPALGPLILRIKVVCEDHMENYIGSLSTLKTFEF
jgi:hypothetical protein